MSRYIRCFSLERATLLLGLLALVVSLRQAFSAWRAWSTCSPRTFAGEGRWLVLRTHYRLAVVRVAALATVVVQSLILIRLPSVRWDDPRKSMLWDVFKAAALVVPCAMLLNTWLAHLDRDALIAHFMGHESTEDPGALRAPDAFEE